MYEQELYEREQMEDLEREFRKEFECILFGEPSCELRDCSECTWFRDEFQEWLKERIAE